MSEHYTQSEFLRDFDAALRANTVPGYPAYDERLRMHNPNQLYAPDGAITLPYDASQPWCPADFYSTHASKPQIPGQFVDRGGDYPPTAQELAEWSDFGVQQDQRHMPVHPFAEAILLGGQTPDGTFVQPGGVVTPGYYYKRGPRKTADLLLVAPNDGVLHGLLVERNDNGLLAIPGGHVDPEDADTSNELAGALSEYEVAGIREVGEETGVSIDVDNGDLSCSGLNIALQRVWVGAGADQRATLHSWPQGEAYAGILAAIPAQQPTGSSDAKTAGWHPLSEATLQRLSKFSSHGTIGRRAVAAYEAATGTRIDREGVILRTPR